MSDGPTASSAGGPRPPRSRSPSRSPSPCASSAALCALLSAADPAPQQQQPLHFLSSMADHFPGLFQTGDFLSSLATQPNTAGAGQLLARNSTKTLKCPKCNWHYKYQETLEIHMKEKHADAEVLCVFCVENQAHPKLARGETYSCGYKPYRCELCKYSTTTKGNLSIHMQSDKHLHALQEIPQSLAAAAVGPSQLLLGQFGGGPQPSGNGHCEVAQSGATAASQPVEMRPELCGSLQCLICVNFSADSFAEMQAHLGREREQPQEGDMAALHGYFQCLLCPYSTNLKANFQLHTRTDKHVQRVQLINHLREGSAVLGVAEQFARLGSLKSAVQVRCQHCHEVFSCAPSLREHCLSRAHLVRTGRAYEGEEEEKEMPQQDEGQPLRQFVRSALVRCGLCAFQCARLDEAAEHANCTQHQPQSPPPHKDRCSPPETGSTEEQQRVQGWAELDAHLLAAGMAQRQPEPEQQAPRHSPSPGPKCPCADRAQPDRQEEHKIPAEVAQRVLIGDEQSTNRGQQSARAAGMASPALQSAIFPHRCAQCAIAFRSAEQLQAHSLAHSDAKFRLSHGCEQCPEPKCQFASRQALERHRAQAHGEGPPQAGGGAHFCDICADGERYESDQALMAHFNSEAHLHRAKGAQNGGQHLGPKSAAPSTSAASLPTRAGSKRNASAKALPYSCNVCCLHFGQPGTLDTHLRSVAHAQRMARLPELVRQGELDPAKAVFEQPEPHPPQRSIGEAAAERARAKSMGKLASSHQNTASPAAQQQVPSSSGPTPLDFKPGPDHQVAQLMAQMLAAAQQHSASPDPAQAAAAAATTFMAAQMAAAAQMASAASGGFGLLDMFGGFPSAMLAKPPQAADSFAEQQHSTGTFPSLLAAALAANGTANSDDLNNNCNEEETPPRAKRARTGSNGTPAQLQQRPQQQWSGLSSGGSREDSFASTPAPSLQQPPLDLASVLQALASDSAVPPLPFAAAGGQPPESGLLMAMAAAATQNPTPVAPQPNGTNNNAPPSPSPQKRARTRIADEQVKILRQYFDINNSPSEEQIKEMAAKAQLPEKVIKHWFRNTLFKERQRDKDSPYNFSIPPQMGIDLATYHRTGEARIIPVVKQEEQKREEGKRPTDAEEEEGPQKAEEEIEKGPERQANTEEEEEEEEEEKAPEEVEFEREQQQAEWEGHSEEQAAANSAAAAAADLLASISKSAAATQQSFPFFGGASSAESFAMFSTLPFHPMLNGLSAAGAPPLAFNPFGASLPPHPQHHHQALNASNSYATSPSVPPSSSTGLPTTATMSSGRRANRTRFTDFQLRTLQQFFDKQAYPKDDDLEMLSNKMNLSPRVIVVWFQNARQKARKVFEQQPHHLQQLAQQQLEQHEQTQQRANFPCCRCDQVFQRYLELVQHQQRVCFAEEQKPEEESEERERGQRETTQELLRQLVAQHTTNAAQQQTEGRRHVPAKPFHKRCPFCGLLFQQRERLLEHIPQRHPEQMAPPDVDALPDAEEVPGMGSLLGGAAAEPLDLSTSSSAMGNEYQKDADSWSHLGASVCASLSPAAFSCSAEENNADHSLSQSCSPFGALASASAAAALMPLFQAQQQLPQQRPHNQLSPGTLNSNSSKRFRTHLTPMQVFIMKSLFNDYKTPSMQECDSLGQKIGLHKRVVQVWFQNARAKERKAAGSGTGSGGESDDSSIPHCGPSAQQCHLCLVPFGPRLSLQEHIFSAEHIEKVRERGAQLRGIGTSGGSGDEAEAGRKSGEQQTKAEPDAEQSAAEAGAPEMAQLAQQFPYGLMYAAAASGLQTGPLPPLLYDPSLFGTPVPALKIPKSVMQLILADMAQRREHTRFTQDGLELAELASRVGEEDFRRASTVDLEVGWGCPQCGNVFQQPEQLQNHQKLICAGADGTFRLVQTHYQCGTCAERFGTQEEFRTHCLGDGHLQKRVKARNNSDD